METEQKKGEPGQIGSRKGRKTVEPGKTYGLSITDVPKDVQSEVRQVVEQYEEAEEQIYNNDEMGMIPKMKGRDWILVALEGLLPTLWFLYVLI